MRRAAWLQAGGTDGRSSVIANGNVRTRADAERCLVATGADAVMSATALLANPRLFASPEPCVGDGARRWRDGRRDDGRELGGQVHDQP